MRTDALFWQQPRRRHSRQQSSSGSAAAAGGGGRGAHAHTSSHGNDATISPRKHIGSQSEEQVSVDRAWRLFVILGGPAPR